MVKYNVRVNGTIYYCKVTQITINITCMCNDLIKLSWNSIKSVFFKAIYKYVYSIWVCGVTLDSPLPSRGVQSGETALEGDKLSLSHVFRWTGHHMTIATEEHWPASGKVMSVYKKHVHVYTDTTGNKESVLIREVASFLGEKCAVLLTVHYRVFPIISSVGKIFKQNI